MNLLALNVSIGAACVGEHGKEGFAVVADKVKKLAQQSVQSTEQVKVKTGTRSLYKNNTGPRDGVLLNFTSHTKPLTTFYE